ncbi:unnamed protein product [Ophioblennius macclurei]
MGIPVLLCALVALLTCPANAAWIGTEFAMSFLQNYLGTYDTPNLQLHIMAAYVDAEVTVEVPPLNFKVTKTLKALESTVIKLPNGVELLDSKRSPNTALIKASANVAVMSFTSKKNTADTSIIYPMSEWGTEYYVYTPVKSPGGTFKEFAVINGKEVNKVVIVPRAAITYEGHTYATGSQLVINLQPYESVQLLSVGDLTNTRITSTLPVGAFTGHTCTWEFSRCNHVYEQLLPVSAWGPSFMVPPLSFQTKYDSVYIQASQPTKISITNGGQTSQITLQAGQGAQLNYKYPGALHIEAEHGIQVHLLFNGVHHSAQKIYDPFLVTIMPNIRYCAAFSFEALAGFENKVLIVAQGSKVGSLRLDGGNMPSNVVWKPIAATGFSWAEMSYEVNPNKNRHIISSTEITFALYSVGIGHMNGYGAPGMCLLPATRTVSCSNVKCGNNEVCVIKGGSPICVPPAATCWAVGDPHYYTFDGRRYDFMGTCTYVIARKCSKDKDLEDFEVLAQNENRGNLRVSYVGLVVVKAYSTTITIVRSERGHVRIGNSLWTLPATLHDGKLKLFQSGRSVVIEAGLGMTVRYDWEQNLDVTLYGSYSGHTCGLCGNFNGKPDDDFTTPAGTAAATAVAFASSWKVPGPADNPNCKDDCVGGCETCDHGKMETWAGDSYCGLLTLKDGPFSKCVATINPQVYVDNCKYDLCMGEGLQLFLCNALEAYAQACQLKGIQVQEWRVKARCSPKCPANSHYELCGSACPATCSHPDAPTKCKRPCVETCTCDKGFVLSGDKCMPVAQCGCTHEGRYLPAGETFWADNECKRLCTCNGKSRQVECQDKGCGKGLKCHVVDGIRKCVPSSYSTCQGTGDPHYLTFDKTKFDFQGTCVYQLVALCSENPDLVPFEVLVQNEHRGSKVVAYTKLVEVKVYSISIVITKTHPGLILVNHELQNLPVALHNGKINVYKNGFFAVVTTDFGLTVRFNWGSGVFVTVPSSYMGAVCGLCGNYNGNRNDDLIPKNGKEPAKWEDFGNSWRVAEIPGCVGGCNGPCPVCDIHEKVKYEGKDVCGLISDPKGPFRDCHAKIDPAPYFEDCVYDVCLYRGRKDILCQAITAYTSACQDQGLEVYSWRKAQFCEVKCPANSHYDICPTGCPATCKTLSPPKGCTANCHEGCVCDAGHILSGNLCVPFSQCGCIYQDRYYKVGQTFYPNGKCERECNCVQGGEVVCKEVKCGPNEECKVVDGVQKCHPKGKGVCVASGDPHYMSFDGKKFDFQGTCRYTLAKSSGLEGTKLVPFSVEVESRQWDRAPKNKVVSVIKLVAVEVYGIVITLKINRAGLLVDGIFHHVPFSHNNGQVQVFQEGRNFVIATNFGLRVTYDLVYHVTVTVPGNYRGKVAGLCGNFNEDQKDDFKMSNNQITANVNEFGKSWKVSSATAACKDGCEGETCPECDAKKKAAFSEDSYCGIITAAKGPLAACHGKLDPQPFLQNCLYDMCVSNGNGRVLCDSVAAYAFSCHLQGVDVSGWRTPSFCPMECPANSHYATCARPCSDSCPGLTDIVTCPDTCTEGCECDTGFLFNGEACVAENECGCHENGRTYKPNEVVFGEGCKEKCTCDPAKGVHCEKHTCPEKTQCMVKNGIRACYRTVTTDPCEDANCRAKEKCVVQDGNAVCVPLYTGKCWAWGDPHYHTFDGHKFDFQGTCKYVLSKTTGKLDGLVPFMIAERNENRGNTAVSYVREVHIHVYGFIITIQKNEHGRVSVNGELLNLPFTLGGGKISASQVGKNAQVVTDFGLIVVYDYNWYVEIKLPSSYHGLVTGLCGNFNADKGDELLNPAGEPVASVAEWGKSWRTKDQEVGSHCVDACQKNCATCSEEDRKHYEGEGFCGAFFDKRFVKCHEKVDPKHFFESCVYDMCYNKGDKKMLCQALAAYDEHCSQAGQRFKWWRRVFGCPMNCQPNSRYHACASPCQPSCPFPKEKPVCDRGGCMEACVCNKGYVLSAGVCVPADKCGCSYQDRYYEPGQRFWADEGCTRLCECNTAKGEVTCTKASCSSKEQCALVDGERACRPISYSTCIASGDPHYLTFDGHRFDYQGTCEYKLVGLCSKQSRLVPFEVTVQNDNRGSKAVSYTKSVTISIHNVIVTISRDYPGKILFNGELVSLPLDYNNELVVFHNSGAALVKTSGIFVSFDWNHKVRVSLPSTYNGAVCGLCGNYNGKAEDDMIMKNGEKAANENKLGESWQVAVVPGCTSACEGDKCPHCSDAQRKVYAGAQFCGVIVDKAGPFKDCHAHVNPAPFLADCVYDVCQFNGLRSALCDALQVYVSACQSKGIKIHDWRSEDFCPMACPANSHYSLCAPSCPATCSSFNGGSSCRAPCAEACVCDDGFLLSGDTCVPVKECGCPYDGRYFQKGDVFYPGKSCNRRCVCEENGAMKCKNTKCPAGHVCKVSNGVKGCHPAEQAKCIASGDPHYTSFDGTKFDFQGTCVYVLAQVCEDRKKRLTPFTVTQGNEKYGNGKVAVTKSVGVSVYDYDINMQQRQPWRVTVDDELVNLPVTLANGRVRVTQEGRNIILRTDFGLTVLYDTVYYVEVIVPSSYQKRTCGLCGFYNKRKGDDFRLPNGRRTRNVDDFGSAWAVDMPAGKCAGCGDQCPQCKPADIKLYGQPDSCGIIVKSDGPFKACHAKVDPKPYASDCVFDVCAVGGKGDALCTSVQAYALACQNEGVQIQKWRSDSFCPLPCPENSHYELCADTCGVSCASFVNPVACSKKSCFEGCQCNEGFVFDGTKCVSADKCGCVHNGVYLMLGQTLVDKDCTTQCECHALGVVKCKKVACASGQVCRVKDGVRGCHEVRGQCTVDQTAKLNSFDGMAGAMGALGAFEAAAVCDDTSDHWFRVVVDVRVCDKGAAPAVDVFYVFFKGSTLTVNSNHMVWVNGKKTSLPIYLENDITVRKAGDTLIVARKSIVKITYSAAKEVSVSIEKILSGKMCGVCGNSNGNSKDDMKKADGTPAADVSQVVVSWSAQGFSRCGLH